MAISKLLNIAIGTVKLAKSRVSRASVFTSSTLTGVLIASKGHPNLDVLILAPLAIFFLSMATYLFNDIFDSEVDRINAPNRPIASQSVSRKEALTFVTILNATGVIIGLDLGRIAFGITFLLILLGVFYSIKPFSFKDRFLVKTLSIGAGGVSAVIFGGAAVGSISPSLIFCSAMFLVFLFATSPINDLADFIGDHAQKRRTIPIVIGSSRTVLLAIVASITPLVSAIIFSQLLGLNGFSILLLTLLAGRSLQLLMPLTEFGSAVDSKLVRRNHKKMVPLHFLLLSALALGAFAI